MDAKLRNVAGASRHRPLWERLAPTIPSPCSGDRCFGDRWAVIRRAVIRWAVIRRAVIRRAVIRRAVFRRAVFRRAVFRWAVFRWAVFRWAVFRWAVFRWAVFRWAVGPRGARLSLASPCSRLGNLLPQRGYICQPRVTPWDPGPQKTPRLIRAPLPPSAVFCLSLALGPLNFALPRPGGFALLRRSLRAYISQPADSPPLRLEAS